jgi:hypothetical protein
MPLFMNVSTGEIAKICQLCSNLMCWTATEDEDGYEEYWWHCHDCDMRNCDEETYED